MTNAEYVAHFLKARGVTHVYELMGGMITFLLDALHQQWDIRIVSVHHEQGAAFAAEGHARMNGSPGVAMATSGPGATNLVTGIGSCWISNSRSTGSSAVHWEDLRVSLKKLKLDRWLVFQASSEYVQPCASAISQNRDRLA